MTLNVSNCALCVPQVDQIPPNTNGSPSRLVMKYGCFRPAVRAHSYQPSAGTRHRRRSNDGAKARDVATVSARALIIRAPPRASADQAGTRPHRATASTRAPTDADTRTIGA